MIINSKLRKLFEPKRRSLTFAIWLAGVIAYDGFRAIVVNYFFSKHGVSGWHYFMFELIFSVIFAWASFQFVLSVVDNRLKSRWIFGILTLLTFFAPDTYIMFVSHKVPLSLYIGLVFYLTFTTLVTIKSLRHDIRNKHMRKNVTHRTTD